MYTQVTMEKLPAITEVLEPAPKKRGRKPGSPKVPGSGRKPGSKNKVRADLREMILDRGKPIELLCDISRGVKIRVGPQGGPACAQYVYPTLQERAAAAKILADMVKPPAAPQTGAGAPLTPETEMSDIEAVRRIHFAFSKVARDKLPPGAVQPNTWDGIKRVISDEPWSPDEPEEVAAREEMYRPVVAPLVPKPQPTPPESALEDRPDPRIVWLDERGKAGMDWGNGFSPERPRPTPVVRRHKPD
jgi:hypothetical protein